MLDLNTQIRLYLDDTTRPIDIDGLVVPPTTLPRPIIRRRWLIAAAAALVVIIAFALPLLLDRPGTPTITQPTPTTVPLDQQPLSELFDLTDWIGVTEEVDNEWLVVLMHPDGTGRVEIDAIDDEGYGMISPDWSPDGTHLVMERLLPGHSNLVEYNLEAEVASPLWSCMGGCRYAGSPAYSPDGESLAFVRVSNNLECAIWTRDVQSTSPRPVESGCQVSHPRWSPDGAALVYEKGDGSPSNQTVVVRDLTTREVMEVTDPNLNAGQPDWSPDGDWIVFCSNANYAYGPDDAQPPGGNLFRVRPDGSDLEQLTHFDLPTPGACEPRYTPDGKWIVFTVDNEIWVMSSEGGDALALLTDGTYSTPDWQP